MSSTGQPFVASLFKTEQRFVTKLATVDNFNPTDSLNEAPEHSSAAP
jgi:hypothetical protein